MTPRRAGTLTDSLLQKTVLHDWFQPMHQAFKKVRYSDRMFQSLPMVSYALLGGLRQLLRVAKSVVVVRNDILGESFSRYWRSSGIEFRQEVRLRSEHHVDSFSTAQ